MSQKKPLRMVLIGAGAISHTHAEALRQSPEAELVAIADVNLEAARKLSSPDDCQSFNDYQDMINSVKPDAAIVCTPPLTHPEICKWLFSKGVHVLCEKPVSIDSKSANEMITAANEAGVKFTMASKFRYGDDMMRAKSMLDSGMIGELLAFENYFTSPVDMSQRWNSNPEMSGGGVLIDNGTHSVDIAHYLLGPIKEIEAVEGKRYQKLPVEDTLSVLLESHDGVAGSIELSWSISLVRRGYVNLLGSDGIIIVGWQTSAYKLNSQSEWVRFGTGYDKLQSFTSQLENFVGAVRDGEPLLITSDDALASVEVIETAYTALRSKAWLPVEYNRVSPVHAGTGYAVRTH